MNQHESYIKRIELEIGELINFEKICEGVYILGGTAKQMRNARNSLALLPFCIRDPSCFYRRGEECNFSLPSCREDQTKIICEILDSKNIPFYFINKFEDVQNAVNEFQEEKGPLDCCIALYCPKDLLEMKEEAVWYIKTYKAPLLTFILRDYEECKINGKSARDFKGQTKADVKKFKEILDSYFLDL